MEQHHNYRRRTFKQLITFFLVLLVLFVLPGFVQNSYTEAEAQQGDVGYQGNSFGIVSAPTAIGNQSKLWFNDGIWWGDLFNPTSGQYEIFRYDESTHNWITTNTAIDTRRVTRADCLWDGKYLYIVSAARIDTTILDHGIRFFRYQYDSAGKQYSLSPGYPILIASQLTNGIVLDQDSSGSIWVTYTSPVAGGSVSVFVSHSLSGKGTQWVTPYVLPVAGATNLLEQEISSLVAHNGRIDLMWSNQNQSAMYYAIHQDGDPDNQWQSFAPIQGPLVSDNHINLKSLQSSSDGRIFAAIKTSLNLQNDKNPDAPLIVLLQINPDGTSFQRTFGTVSEKHTRPLLLIDNENRILYMFATSYFYGNGRIYVKALRLDDPSAQFIPGLGTPFLDFGDTSNINNITSTKQMVNNTTGILVLAEDTISGNYVYNSIDLSTYLPPVFTSHRIMLPLVIQ